VELALLDEVDAAGMDWAASVGVAESVAAPSSAVVTKDGRVVVFGLSFDGLLIPVHDGPVRVGLYGRRVIVVPAAGRTPTDSANVWYWF
jgi:hypothetical protein